MGNIFLYSAVDWDNTKAKSYKDKDNIIRLISARKATKPESKIYKEYL